MIFEGVCLRDRFAYPDVETLPQTMHDMGPLIADPDLVQHRLDAVGIQWGYHTPWISGGVGSLSGRGLRRRRWCIRGHSCSLLRIGRWR